MLLLEYTHNGPNADPYCLRLHISRASFHAYPVPFQQQCNCIYPAPPLKSPPQCCDGSPQGRGDGHEMTVPPVGGHEQRILSSHIPPCHRHMVIATTFSSLLVGWGGGDCTRKW